MTHLLRGQTRVVIFSQWPQTIKCVHHIRTEYLVPTHMLFGSIYSPAANTINICRWTTFWWPGVAPHRSKFKYDDVKDYHLTGNQDWHGNPSKRGSCLGYVLLLSGGLKNWIWMKIYVEEMFMFFAKCRPSNSVFCIVHSTNIYDTMTAMIVVCNSSEGGGRIGHYKDGT